MAMAVFLSDEWLDMVRHAAQTLPRRPGVTAVVHYTIAAGKGAAKGSAKAEKAAFVARVQDGQLVELTPGKGEADCAVQLSVPVARAILEREVSRDVAFMRGDLKIDGDYAAYVLRLQPLLASDEMQSLQSVIAASTTFA